MHRDRYGNPLSSSSADAREAYVEGLDRLLEASTGMEALFTRAVEADGSFALAHLGLARARKILGEGGDILGPLAQARELAGGASEQEQGLVHCIGTLLEGDSESAWCAIRQHVNRYPRDVLAIQPTTGVFGLIGFSGRAGRETEHLDWCESLAPHFQDDWWFLAQLGFARVESGDPDAGRQDLEWSLEGNPNNANAAHYYGHALYERGEHENGYGWLNRWMEGYDPTGPMNCHLWWHLALWALYLGNPADAWAIRNQHIVPEKAAGPPINVFTDGVSLLHRATLSGQTIPTGAWRDMAQYAGIHFANPGIAFADVHAALASAMAGDSGSLAARKRIDQDPATDLVAALARAFEAFAAEDWPGVVDELAAVMPDHARIGGSRAQRDLIENTLAYALVRLDRAEEAATGLSNRRPGVLTPYVIDGIRSMPGSATAASAGA